MSYYTSTEEARSDLFLAGAWFVFSPLLIDIFLGFVPLGRIPGVGEVLTVVLPLVYTVLVPVLLMRYRREPLSAFGLHGGVYALGLGLVVAIPLVLATVVVSALQPGAAQLAGLFGRGAPAVTLLGRLAFWFGLAALGVYATVKARDAFGGYSLTLREGVVQIGRILAIAAGAATLLLALGGVVGTVRASLAEIILYPAAVAAMVFVALRTLRRPSVTTRATLAAPTVLLALGGFRIAFQAQAFIFGIWRGALLAGIGLVIGILMEGRRTALSPVGMGLTIAVLTFL